MQRQIGTPPATGAARGPRIAARPGADKVHPGALALRHVLYGYRWLGSQQMPRRHCHVHGTAPAAGPDIGVVEAKSKVDDD